MTTLDITSREGAKTLEALRAEGKVPAVLYGPKEPTASIAVDAKVFDKVFKEAGESTVVTLQGLGEDKDAMIHEVTYHPVTGKPLHVDFYVIEKGKKVQTNVPLEFVGEAPAVKSLGGTLMKIMHEIEIEAMPKDLPHEIVVDISVLHTFDAHITLADLKLPAGVVALGNPEDTVASVAEPKEEVEEPVAAIDMESIEVEKKGKADEEGGGEDGEGKKDEK
jgi:large subunit ribosomal protein L25